MEIIQEDVGLIVAMWMVTVFPAMLAVLARAFARFRIDGRKKASIILADVLILVSFLSSIWYVLGMSLVVIYGIITVGRGLDANSRFIDNGTTVKALKVGYATGNVYYLGLYTAKGAMLSLLYGIIPETSHLHRKFLHYVTIFIFLCGVFTIFFNLFGCWPLQYNWILGPENCYAYRLPKVLITSTVLQLLTDLILVGLPLPLLRRLRVSTRQKIGLACIFCLGFVCIFATMMRIILTFGPNIDAADGGYSVVWSGVEMSTSICVACAPAVRSITTRNRTGNTTNGSGPTGRSGSGGAGWSRRKTNRTNTGVAELDQSPYESLEMGYGQQRGSTPADGRGPQRTDSDESESVKKLNQSITKVYEV